MKKTEQDIVTSITNIINFRDKNIDRIAACLIIALLVPNVVINFGDKTY